MKINSYLESEEEESASRLVWQAVWFFIHAILALGSWLGLMLAGYAIGAWLAPRRHSPQSDSEI